MDEEKIRNSDRELYVVTYSISDRHPMIANVKEAPEGAVADLLMASAYLIGFRQERLGGKYYMDGGGINNVPVDVLLDRGYKDVIVLRIYGYGVDTEKKLEVPGGVNLYHVAPRRDLGGSWSLTDAGREETCCWDILTENVCFMVWRDVSIILMRRKVNHITLTR